jgi:hypothetical protein
MSYGGNDLLDKKLNQVIKLTAHSLKVSFHIRKRMTKQPEQAPWSDFAGNSIYEGDTIRHPDGDTGVVVKVEAASPSDAWRVDYGDSYLSRLGLQIGERGQAVVVNTRSH